MTGEGGMGPPRWRAHLDRKEQSLDNLLKPAGDDWCICEDRGDFYLTSPHWTDPTAGSAVHDVAQGICDRLNLVQSLQMPEWRPLSITGVRLVTCDGQIAQRLVWRDFVFLPEWTAARPPGGAVVAPVPGERALHSNPKLADAIYRFLHFGHDWTQLVKVIEGVRGALNGEIPPDWVSKTKLKLLERTAQFQSAAGDTARHISANGMPPPNPMGLPEAQAIVRTILVRCLSHFAGASLCPSSPTP
jgi:hypothetical protein